MNWQKSSYSVPNGNCVEVASLPDGMAVRDTKDPDGPVLRFSSDEWSTFLANVKTGRCL